MAVVTLKPVQVAELVNIATKQTLGEDGQLVQEDLSNGVVDLGVQLENANAYKNWCANLMIEQAQKIFSYRKYNAKDLGILKSNFEYGLLTQKIKQKLPKAVDNSSFKLVNNASYDDNVYHKNDVLVKIFKEQATFECVKSITEEQLKTAFTSDVELSNFVSQTFGYVENALELFMENLEKLTINNMIGETFVNNTGADENVRVIKLLTNYKTEVDPSSTLTSDTCLFNKEFIRYAVSIINEYMGLLEKYNTIFNVEHLETFTPKDLQHVLLLEKFNSNAKTYLDSDTFHNEFVQLPYGRTIPYFQSLGDGSLKDKSTINIKTASGNDVNKSYIVACIFDHDALGMRQNKPRNRSHEVNSAEFTNYWFKKLFSYFNDMSESMVVFTLE